MKKIITLILIFSGLIVTAQNDVNLILNHQFNGTPFAYNNIYTDDQGRAVKFSRVQYYMSSIEVVHDGNQTTPLTDVYVLGSANVSNYYLGNFNISNVEEFNFDLGVDYAANHGNSSDYTAPHPLSPQTPLMDWGWPSGYFFFVIDGYVDDNNDGVPNKMFQMRALGDVMLRDVDMTASSISGTGSIDINLDVNIEKWITNIDLATTGIDHSSSANNQNVATNTVTYSVFNNSTTTGIYSNINNSYITTDYSMTYAPVLNYKLGDNTNHSLTILDSKGRVVAEEESLGFEGSYFVKQELNSGIYYAIFQNNSNAITHKFIVKR
jgi:hypothetical protein